MPVSLRSRVRGMVTVLGLAVLLMVGVAPGREQPPRVQALAWVVLVALLAALLWLRRRERAAYEEALTEQAARTAVAEDRLAIARDLHDLVSGSLGAITVRAAVAQRLESDVEGLRTALSEVEQTSRAATADLRSMLAVLRGQGVAPVSGPRPLPEAVEQAADGARALGLMVRTRVEPGAAAPAAQDLALAVVREGLANVARHAGPVEVDVSVLSDGEALGVEITDAGPAPGWVAQPGTGTGLAALAERAVAVGARLRSGPQAGRAVEDGGGLAVGTGPGFRLSARIPLDAGAPR